MAAVSVGFASTQSFLAAANTTIFVEHCQIDATTESGIGDGLDRIVAVSAGFSCTYFSAEVVGAALYALSSNISSAVYGASGAKSASLGFSPFLGNMQFKGRIAACRCRLTSLSDNPTAACAAQLYSLLLVESEIDSRSCLRTFVAPQQVTLCDSQLGCETIGTWSGGASGTAAHVFDASKQNFSVGQVRTMFPE